MIPRVARLGMRIHLVGGTILQYEQTDPDKASETMKHVHPSRVFAQDFVTIAGDYSTTSLKIDGVTSIELLLDEELPWSFGPNIRDIIQISEQEFIERAAPGAGDPSRRREQTRPEGEEFVGYDHIRLIGGESIYVEVHGTTRNRAIQGNAAKRIFDNPAFLARIPGQGLHCINTTAVSAFEFFPGSPEVPKNSWLLNLDHGA